MFSWRGGSLGSDPGGELAGEPPEEPQDEEPELEEDIELVLCRDGIPCTSLLFTTCRPLTKVGRPIVSAGLLFLLLFFLLLFCFSLSLFWPPGPELVGFGGTQLRSFLSEPPPHLQWQASITKLYPCCFHKFCNFCFSDQLRSFFCPSLVLFK